MAAFCTTTWPKGAETMSLQDPNAVVTGSTGDIGLT